MIFNGVDIFKRNEQAIEELSSMQRVCNLCDFDDCKNFRDIVNAVKDLVDYCESNSNYLLNYKQLSKAKAWIEKYGKK